MNSSHITNETLQFAVDAACESTANSEHRPSVGMLMVDANKLNDDWQKEAPARLHLARALLDLLPEPTPLVAELNQEHYRNAMDELRGKRAALAYASIQLEASKTALQTFVDLWARWPNVSAHEMQEASRKAKDILGASKPTPPVVDGKTPGQVAFEAWANSPPSCDSHQWLDVCVKTSWEAAASAVLAARAGQEAEPKPKPSTFTAHGKTWTRHTPGDPMPCDGERKIYCIDNLGRSGPFSAQSYDWSANRHARLGGNITCWRYADEPTPEPEVKPWTPSVGDLVQLKSGGPVMTIERVLSGTADVAWINNHGDIKTANLCITSLTPAKEDAQ